MYNILNIKSAIIYMKKLKIDLSYQERNHWIEFLVGFAALLYYYFKIKSFPGGFNADLGLVVVLIVKVSVFTTIGLIVLLAISRSLSKEKIVESDERDDQIALRAYRNAYHYACSMLFITMISALYFDRINKGLLEGEPIEMINVMCHTLFFIGWGAWWVESLTRIYYYRRGIV